MPLPFESDQLPPKYKTHLPAESTDSLREMGDFMAEPFIGAGKRLRESLSRIYKVAAQPMTGEPIRPSPREETPIEYYASIAARIVALPLVMMKEILDISTAARTGAGRLRGGPRGELGEWTPEQYEIAAAATMTAGAAVGGGGGAAQPAAIGRGAAYKMLAKDFRALTAAGARKLGRPAEVSASRLAKKFGITEKTAEFILKKKEGPVYREIAKGLKHIPQEILDPIKEVRLMRGKGAQMGGFQLKSKRIRIAVDQPTEEALGTLGHEFIHAEQLKKSPGMFKRKSMEPLLEKHAYAAEKGFVASVKALPKGERITKKAFDKIYKAGLEGLRKQKLRAKGRKGGELLKEGETVSKAEWTARYNLTPSGSNVEKLMPFKTSTPRGQRAAVDFLKSITADKETQILLKEITNFMDRGIFSYEDALKAGIIRAPLPSS